MTREIFENLGNLGLVTEVGKLCNVNIKINASL